MKRIILTALILVVTGALSQASDVAVAVDVSGSMAKYGPWQPDAQRVIQNILERGSLGAEEDNWTSSGDLKAIRSFQAGSGERIQLIRFGSINHNLSTFFPVQPLGSPAELNTTFPELNDFKDAHTNKELATAVAVKLVGEPSKPARIISISDFLSDADLSKEQQEFVNVVMNGTEVENNLTLSWKKNPRVMVRLQRIVLPAAGQSQTSSSSERRIELMSARLNQDSKSLLLAWKAIGEKPTGYDVKVSSSDGTQQFYKIGLISNEAIDKDAPGGEITWTVVAHYGDGRIVTASRREQLPESGNLGVIIAIALIGILLLVGFFLMRKHGDNLVATVKKTFGRSAGSDF